ncbi:sigma-70 family RNA polymerase sigma factor [Cytobacillus gottheilii]|uniref:sigma-70 family RNA polymerase sigma factor n=1 Tax=Cytobacillus gottheilii TaxID=859144 RepID=UPI003CEB002C
MEIADLLKKARKGDEHAFYLLLKIHRDRLLKVAISYLKNEGEALEALQEVTFRAYKSIKKVKKPEYFSTWITRIMLNYCHDQAKHRKRMTVTDLFEEDNSKEDYEQKIVIEDALAKIDDRSREVIILKYYHDLKIKEIADILGSPESTIKTWLYKGMKSLRKELDEGSGIHV